MASLRNAVPCILYLIDPFVRTYIYFTQAANALRLFEFYDNDHSSIKHLVGGLTSFYFRMLLVL